MMKDFKFSYDKENDDLFIYLEGAKSKGAIELGNFVFDFDENEDLVAIQIFEASKMLSKLLFKIIELTKINGIRAEMINFRNMSALRIEIITNFDKFQETILIPNIRQKSPALAY